MSEAPHRPGLWPASDGKWYSPERHPDYIPPPPPPVTWTKTVPRRRLASSAIKKVATALAIVLVVAIIAGIADGGRKHAAPTIPSTTEPIVATSTIPTRPVTSPSAARRRATSPPTSTPRVTTPSVATTHTTMPSVTQRPQTVPPTTTPVTANAVLNVIVVTFVVRAG
jgi:hypothetical protein